MIDDKDVADSVSSAAASLARKGSSRRRFLGQVGAAATFAAGAFAAPALGAAGQSSHRAVQGIVAPEGVTDQRLLQCFSLRVNAAVNDAQVPASVNIDNGDEALYDDKGGTYTKGLPHDSFGRVDPAAYASFKNALTSGKSSDFDKIIIGGPRTLNDPQSGLAFDMVALDNAQFGQPTVPPAPPIAGDVTGNELLEHYWGALLRDVNFSDYGTDPMAAQAAAELGSLPGYLGPRDNSGQLTTGLLFRGSFPGENLGPYVSQLFVKPTALGAQPITQQLTTYVPEVEYMTNFNDWVTVQNGGVTGQKNQVDPQLRYARNGRDLAAYTHVDVLYQAYFTAMLVLGTIGAPLNPGNPYVGSKNQNGFGTFGGPDISATLAEVSTKALNAVWYQKWFVHLRPRPEATGGQVHLIKIGHAHKTDVRPSPVVMNSIGLKKTFDKFGTWLLPQAFPEGSPTHPSYPTGHGTVAGACITILKFFYDGDFVIPDPVVPSADGLSLEPYTGSDAGQLTVNGELNKLGHNISFGHGIHSGIHWRSDTDTSLLLGEAVALSFLKDRAKCYNNPFNVTLTKFDGTKVTISNPGNP